MSDLSKRTYKYYFFTSFKFFGYQMIMQLALVLEWILIGSGEKDPVEYVVRMFVMMGGVFTILLNAVYAVYGPSLYDSLSLSMGARRKDIFWGQLLKQIILITCNTVVHVTVAIVSGKEFYISWLFVAAFIALIAGAGGYVVGHKIRRYGKIIVVIIAFGAAILGGFIGAQSAIYEEPYIFVLISQTPAIVFFIVVFAIVVGFQVWGYKLTQKMMVQ